jgi:hypothetical protein
MLSNVLRNFQAGAGIGGDVSPAAPGNFFDFLGGAFGGGLGGLFGGQGGQLEQLGQAFGQNATMTSAQQAALALLGQDPDFATQGAGTSAIQNIIGSQLSPAFRRFLPQFLNPLFSQFQVQNPGQSVFEAFLQGNLGTGFGGFGQ